MSLFLFRIKKQFFDRISLEMFLKAVILISLEFLNLVYSYSNETVFNYLVISKLATKYNINFIIYAYSREIQDHHLIERIFESNSICLMIKRFEDPKIFPKSRLILIKSNNFTINISDLMVQGDIFILISNKSYENWHSKITLQIQNTRIFGKQLCNTENNLSIELEEILEYDKLLLKSCSFELYKHSYYAIDFPLVDLRNGTHGTGKFHYFSHGLLEYLTKTFSKSTKASENSSKLEFRPDLILMMLETNNLENSGQCLVVPKLRPISEELYTFYAYKCLTWIVIFMSLFYIAMATKYLFNMSYFQGLQFGIALITWTSWDPLQKYLKIRHFRQLIVFNILCIYGFWLTNIYSAKLSTFLTTYVYGKDIETVNDVLESGLKIMVDETVPITNRRKDLQNSFVKEGDRLKVWNNIMNFNRSYGYFILNYFWEYLKFKQELLTKKKFHLTKICDNYDSKFLLFEMLANTNKFKYLKPYLLKYSFMIDEAGLMDIWNTLSYIDMSKFKKLKSLRDDGEVRKPLTLLFYKKIWILVGSGWIIAFMVFLFENIFTRY